MGREGLLFDLERDTYFAINHSARLIWLFIEASSGVTAAEIVDHLADRFAADRAVVSSDVTQLLIRWRDVGLVAAEMETHDHE